MQAHHPTWERDPQFVPTLRADLKLVPHEQLVRFYEPTMQRFVQLYPLECHIAQQMNGARNLDELTALARQFNSNVTRAVIEKLVRDLSAAGLLVAQPAAPTSEREIEWADVDNDETVLERSSMLAPNDDVFEARPQPNLRVVPALPPQSRTVVGIVPSPSPFPDQTVVAADAEDDEDWPEPEQQAPSDAKAIDSFPASRASAANIADQEQEELWKDAHARKWHQRTSVRFLAVVGLVIGTTAVIPYPLRVTSDCTLIPSERVEVRSELKGVISEILVDEGQLVKKGDVIARLDDRALKAERVKKLAEIDKDEAELAVLRQGRRPEEIQQQVAVLSARRNEAAFAAKEANRRGQMAKEGVGSRQGADEAMRDAETKRRAVAEADAALRLLQAGSRPEEIAAQEAVEKGAKAELAYIDDRIAMSVVRAPIDGGVLTARFREHVNQGVEAGGLVCEIANTRIMRAEISMPERDVDVVAVGMPAVIKVESYPTQPFEGKVNFIAPTVDATKTVRVVVELDNASGMLKSNMSGYGEVEAGKRSLLTLGTRRIVRWIRVRFLL